MAIGNSWSILVACFALAAVAANADEPRQQSSPQTPAWFKNADKNGDGKLSRDEAPNKDVFGEVDTDGDGFASLAEVNVWLAKRAKAGIVVDRSAIQRPANQRGFAERTTTIALPDNVEKRSVTIWSDGTSMAGDLYLPKERKLENKLPAIVFCAGTGGTKGGTGGRLGPISASHGYVTLAFDYRGWGESDSPLMAVEPQPKPDANGEMTIKVRALRWQMNYADQTADIRAAISFLAGEPTVDPERIGIMGSSYGGGLVTWVAGNDPRVKCVAAQVPGLGAARTPAAERSMFRLHSQQARGETEPVPITTGKLGGKLERYDQMRANPAKNIGFSAADAATKINIPIVFVVAENEELSNNDNVLRIHETIKERGVPTEFHVIKGISHYGVYREGFEEATRVELAFFEKHLLGP